MAVSLQAHNYTPEQLALQNKRLGIFRAKQQRREAPANWTIREDINWLNMAKNLANPASFYVWVSRLYDYNKGILFRYMLINQSKFSVEVLEEYNKFLAIKGEPSRYQIPIQ